MKHYSKGILLALAIGVFAFSSSTDAQTQTKLARIGFLQPYSSKANVGTPPDKAFNAGMAELGYVDGKNLVWESRSAEHRLERLPALAAEIVAARPDVILLNSCGAELDAMRRATSTIPIVVGTCTEDMVASGIVKSLARPGGNVTGQQKLTPELSAKRLELLKQLLPGLARVAVLWNPDYSALTADWHALRSAAAAMKVTLLPFEARLPADYGPAFAAMSGQRVDALYTFTDTLSYQNVQTLADLAAKYRLPSIWPYREGADAGGLIGYGPNIAEMWHHVPSYIDKILKGAKPSELPIEQPRKFDLVINLKTAKLLGLTIPRSARERADEVIE